MKGEIRTILVDVDDCLLPTVPMDGTVSSAFYAGLREVSEFVGMANRGVFPPIGWCSGRERGYLEAVSFVVGLPDSWSVIESGISLFNPTTKEMVLNPGLTPEIRAAFEEISRERIPAVLERYPGLFLYPGNMINIALERRHGVDLSIGDCYLAVRDEIGDLVESGLVNVHHSRIAVDISPAGIDKGSGIRFLSQHTGIEPSEMLGIGDSKGDFPMLGLVGYAACPANASQECKELVQYRGGRISPYEYAQGVADTIRFFNGK